MKNRFLRQLAMLVAGITLSSCATSDDGASGPVASRAGEAGGKVIVIDPGHGGSANAGSDAARHLTLELVKAMTFGDRELRFAGSRWEGRRSTHCVEVMRDACVWSARDLSPLWFATESRWFLC